MIPSRRVFALAIASGVVPLLLTGLANAHPSGARTRLAVALSAKKIDFGKVPAGARSSPRTVTLTNKSSLEMAAPTVSVTGTGFSLGSNGCAGMISAQGKCSVSVTFAPPSKGKFKQGLLKFADSAAGSPQKVKLVGVGVTGPSPTATPTASQTPVASLTPTSTSTAGSATPTATATATPTSTSGATATATSSATATATSSATATRTATFTATSTQRNSSTPTATETRIATATRTASATASSTAASSVIATLTATFTPTSTTTATPTLTATAAPAPTPTATSTAVFNIVFVSSTSSNGDLGGQTGADAQCASLAVAANLPSGTYKAWLSTSTVNAVTKLGSARGFVRPDGAPFADQVSDIAAGTILNPLDLDESDVDLGRQSVWTGTTDAVTVNDSTTCADWMSGTGASFGEQGISVGGSGAWSDDAVETDCLAAAHFYCFDTSHISALTVTPTPGRVAFVSSGSFATSEGLSTADTICQTEAVAAGLANPTQFLALLSTSTASAASRFDMSAMSAPFVRPDGIEIADAQTLASGATLSSGIWQHADGTYITEFAASVWTGSTAPNVTGTLATTCDDWNTLNGADTGSEGVSNVTDTWWSSGATTSCGEALPVYCLEQ